MARRNCRFLARPRSTGDAGVTRVYRDRKTGPVPALRHAEANAASGLAQTGHWPCATTARGGRDAATRRGQPAATTTGCDASVTTNPCTDTTACAVPRVATGH